MTTQLLDSREAAEYMNISKDLLHYKIKRGELQPTKVVGRYYFFSEADLKAHIRPYITPPLWDADTAATYRGVPVRQVRHAAKARYYDVITDDGNVHTVYCNEPLELTS